MTRLLYAKEKILTAFKYALSYAWVSGLLAALLAILWFTSDDAKQPKQDARSAKASAETAIEAAQTVIDRSQGDRSIDQFVNETSEAIENETDPKVAGDLARDAICRLLHDSNDPACKLQ